MTKKPPVVAIDGPSGSGKGTLAAALAQELGWHFLDSGALYRIVAAMALRAGVALDDEARLAELAANLEISFTDGKCIVDGLDLTDEIRNEDVGAAASQVALLGGVRGAVLAVQHGFRKAPGLIADGRDMGTVVFPEADLKIFLDASASERADRRYKQLKNKGLSVSLPGLLAQIQQRDARDRGRAIAPLKPAPDAVVIDSTGMSIEAVLDQVKQLIDAAQLR